MKTPPDAMSGGVPACQRSSPLGEQFGIIREEETLEAGRRRKLEKWGQDKRRDVVLVDIDQLVPADHMLRK